MDQCKNCSARGNMGKCIEADCTIHESWYVLELIKQLQNTSSNSEYMSASPQSCKDLPVSIIGDVNKALLHIFAER